MSNFTCYVGEQIRKYRKAGKMTCRIWQMPSIKVELPYANMKMEISPLISKLYMRSARFSRYLCPSLPLVFLKQPVNRPMHREKDKKAHFFRHSGYIFTFTMDAISVRRMASSIFMKKGESGKYEATLTICSVSANGRSSEILHRKSSLQ